MDVPTGVVAAARETDKIEILVPSVGFDDLLDATLPFTLPHADHLIVVTSHTDAKTVAVCRKYNVSVVQTDLFGESVSKGAAINAGFTSLRYRGWRLLLDADIALPFGFRRMLLNHTALDTGCLYGADRADVVGPEFWAEYGRAIQWGTQDEVHCPLPLRPRLIIPNSGYLPIGYFQLWHASTQRPYPSTLGGTGLDDVAFAQQWPQQARRLLPSVIVYHFCVEEPQYGENWDGIRRHPRRSI